MITASTITCPKCGYQATEQMPTDACQFFYDCRGCGERLKPEAGDCCVFCSYGTMPCPPTQLNRSHCAPREDPHHLSGIMRIAVAFRAIGDTALDKAQPGPLRLEHNVILVLLLAFAAASWAVLVWQHGDGTMLTRAAMITRRAIGFRRRGNRAAAGAPQDEMSYHKPTERWPWRSPKGASPRIKLSRADMARSFPKLRPAMAFPFSQKSSPV